MWARFDKRTKQVIPCSMMMEASLACSRENNSLLLEQAGPCHVVSTVFLPLAHSWGNRDDCHFETYVFPGKNGEITDFGEVDGLRGTTYAEAVMNHAQLVLKYTEVIRA